MLYGGLLLCTYSSSVFSHMQHAQALTRSPDVPSCTAYQTDKTERAYSYSDKTRMCLYSYPYSYVLLLVQQRSSPVCSYCCNCCVQLVSSYTHFCALNVSNADETERAYPYSYILVCACTRVHARMCSCSYNNARARDAATAIAVSSLCPHALTFGHEKCKTKLQQKRNAIEKKKKRNSTFILHDLSLRITSIFKEKLERACSYSYMLVCACTRTHTRMCSCSCNSARARATATAATAVFTLFPQTLTFVLKM